MKEELRETAQDLKLVSEILEKNYTTCTQLAEDLQQVSDQINQHITTITQKLANAAPEIYPDGLEEIVGDDTHIYFLYAKTRDITSL